MKWLAAPLRRPIATAAVYTAVLGLALASLPGLPLGLAPDLDPPRLSVFLSWPNAAPEEMESLVTSRVEASLSSLAGVEEIASMSAAGFAFLDVAFERGVDMDLAEVDVRDALAELRTDLPAALATPEIERVLPENVDPGAFFVLRVTGDRTPEALRRWLDDQVLPALAAVPGVAGTQAYGGGARELRLELRPEEVEAGRADPALARETLARLSLDRSVGGWAAGSGQIPVTVDRPKATATDLARLASGRDESDRRWPDVGRIVDAWASPRALARLDGRPSVQGVLEREPGTNVVAVAEGVRERLGAMPLPPDVDVAVVHDESESVRREMRELGRRSGFSLVLILAVLIVARGGVRSPLVVMTSVAFSALATFGLFRLAGLGFNLVTMSGLVLAFGLSVDNSIVLLESVALRSRGRPHPLRTLAATREVLFPLLAATATTAVVMTPFLYLDGELRDWYFPFVLAVVLSLKASLVVSLTLVPLLARFALHRSAPARHRWLTAGLDASVRGALRRPWVPIVLSLALLGGSLWVFEEKVPKGSIFAPEPDTTLRVNLGFPPGTDLPTADRLIRRFEDHVLAHEFAAEQWIEQVEVLVQETQASVKVKFPPAIGFTTIPASLQEELTLVAATISGADVSVSGQGPGFQHSKSSVSPSYLLRVSGPEYRKVGELAESLAARLERNPRIRDVDANGAGMFVEDARELVLRPRRDALAQHGLTLRDLTAALAPAVTEELFAREVVGPQGPVTLRLQLAGQERAEVADLREFLVPNASGVSVPLRAVADIEERRMPGQIRKRDQRYERAVAFDYRGPRRVGDRFTKSLVENTELPPGYRLEDGLGFFLTAEESRDLHRAIGLAVVLVLLVSAALFESLALPLIAMLAIPLSFTGIPFVFWAAGETFDRTAYVGLILLAGIAINNALLLVHRAGRLLHRTGDRFEAARRATLERARPILLTTATSAAGLLPLAWSGATAGVTTWRAFALAAIAGLVASSLFTLYVVPCFFTRLTREPRRPGAPPAVSTVTLEEVLS